MTDGITRIAVEGFKSIAKRQEIEIRPLTILAGANSSGKSSIMQPLLMLKQTLEAPYDPGPLKIDGPNAKFTSSEQFLSKEGSPGQLRIALSAGGLDFTVSFFKTPKSGLEVERNTFRRQTGELTLRPGMSLKEVQDALVDFVPTSPYAHFDVFEVQRDRFLLKVKNAGGILTTLTLDRLVPCIQEVIHVPGLRGNVSRTYQVIGDGPNFPGTFEHYTASVISRWQSDDSDRYRFINRDIGHVGLAQVVISRKVNETELELRVNRIANGRSDDSLSIADVGFGVSQTLPVLVALRAADAGRLVYLEEPEIHLHPRAQTKLAEVLADAARRGVRVVAETHSSLLLTAIQTLVAKRELDRNLVKLHWFQRDPQTGIRRVCSADLDENGAFGDWPEDFDDVTLSAERQYMDAVTERSTG